MKYLILLLSIGVVFHSQAQTSAPEKRSASPTGTISTLPGEIKSTKTPGLVNIPGTRVFVAAPQGFTASSELPALQKGEEGMIQAMDLDGGNYYTNAADFNRKSFEAQGIKVLEYGELKVNQYPAKMILMQSPDGVKVYDLVFGDTTFSVMVMGIFHQSDEKTGADIQNAIKTIYYDKSFKVDPFAHAVFTLDDTKTRLKFAQYAASMYVYSVKGGRATLADDNPMFMVSVLPAESQSPEIVADMMLNKLREKDTPLLSTENPITGKTNGFPSFQREAYMIIQGKKTLIYQHVVIMDNTAIIMQGESTANFPASIKDFKTLSGTIRKK